MSRSTDLVEMRDRLWDGINGGRLLERPSKDGDTYTAQEPLAPLVRELRAVVRELAELGESSAEVSVADEIAARREARLTGTDDSPSASRRSQPRRRGGSD